jgi:hypothetical protein
MHARTPEASEVLSPHARVARWRLMVCEVADDVRDTRSWSEADRTVEPAGMDERSNCTSARRTEAEPDVPPKMCSPWPLESALFSE